MSNSSVVGTVMRWFVRLLAALALAGSVHAQTKTPDGAWTLLPDHPAAAKAADPWIQPKAGQALAGDMKKIRAVLAAAPLEGSPDAKAKPFILELPDPDGQLQKFSVVESPIMEPGLAAQFPDIHTYLGQGITDPYATLRADVTMLGFHAQVLTVSEGPGGSWYIDPYVRDDTENYTSYRRWALTAKDQWSCGVTEQFVPNLRGPVGGGGDTAVGTTLRTYRLACAATGEYTAFFGGTVAQGQAAIVTAINRVTGVYEKDLCIRLTLVANNSSLVYTNSATDPYTNGNGSTMLGQNQNNITSVIGSANYDIGHVFSTGGGGIAGLGVVCIAGNKARGVTGSGSPNGDAFWIDYVAHEMGHQFGANHNFQGTTSSCGGGNRNGSTADEPGSGSTIMGYAGICGADDIQPNSDAYFNWISYEEILSFASGVATCSVNTATGNSAPTISASGGVTIPKGTPFALTATASDPNGDAITYCWEDANIGGATSSTLAAADNGSMPLFRSLTPVTSSTRLFPKLATVLAGTTDIREKYPQVSRAALAFRVTARDNRAGGGGVANAAVSLGVTSAAGPFTITSPASATTWGAATSQTVTWNVAGTTANGVNCANVSILFSTDGGNTFPITILASTPNDGAETIAVPSNLTTTGRIKIQSIGNVFYAINLGSITVNSTSCIGASIATQPTNQTGCVGGSASLTVAGGGTTPFSYQWRKSGVNVGGATSATLTFNPVTALNAGSYDCVVTNACGTATSNSVTLTVNTPVSISASPASITRCPGQSAAFSVTASGTPTPTYQWRKGTTAIVGATSSTYTIASVAAGDAANYDCIVTNSCGSVTSSAATLTVGTLPNITTQPSSQTVCEGGAVSFLVAATGGGPFTYQWKLNGGDISGGTATNYSINPVEPLNGGNYTCVVTNACGSTTSNVAVLTVRALPSFTTQPSSLARCAGQAASFSIATTGFTPITHQWQKNNVDIPGATGTTLNLASVGPADVGSYTCIATNTCGSNSSTAASLTLQTAPSITTQPTAQSACIGGSASFTVAASGSPTPTFAWRKNGDPIPGATSAVLTINPVGSGDAASYDCVVTNVCSTATSAAAGLTVNEGPSISAQPADQTVCSGLGASFTVTASGTPAPTYQWRKGGSPIGGATSSTYSIPIAGAGDVDSYDCVVTNSCGSVTSAGAALALNSGPSISVQPSDQTACDGAPSSFSVTATGTPAPTYQWRRNTVVLPGETSSTLSIASASGANSGAYDCVVTNSCGEVTSTAASLTVESGPTIGTQPVAAAPCVGAPAAFSVSATGTPTLTFQWRKDTIAIGGATSDTYSIAAAAAGDVASYDCVVTNSCGSVTSSAAALTLGEPPSITMQPSAAGGCDGGTITLTVAASGTEPFGYQWRKNTIAIGGATAPSLMLAPLNENDTASYDCVVSNACGSVTSDVAGVVVQRGPGLTGQPADATACVGATTGFTVAVTDATGFQWQLGGNPLNDGPTGGGSVISGATTSSMSISGVALADAGAYRCIVSAACGSLTSDVAQLSVSDGPTITQQPTGQTVCSSAPASLSVGATGGAPVTYQWRKGGSPLGGATSATLNITSAVASDTGSYDCIVTDPCGTATSDAAMLLVCIADFNCSGVVSVQDIFDFLAGYFAGDPRADVNASGMTSVQDIFDFLAAYFAGCA